MKLIHLRHGDWRGESIGEDGRFWNYTLGIVKDSLNYLANVRSKGSAVGESSGLWVVGNGQRVVGRDFDRVFANYVVS